MVWRVGFIVLLGKRFTSILREIDEGAKITVKGELFVKLQRKELKCNGTRSLQIVT